MDQEDHDKRDAAVDDLRLFIQQFQIKYQKPKNLNQYSGHRYLDLQGNLELNLFGSTVSGFGSKGSDLDCCLIVRDPETKKIYPTAIEAGFTSEKATTEIILLADMMKRWKVPGRRWHENQIVDSPIFIKIEPVPDAKVPIVKFKHAPTGLEGDISICNILPLRNTKLLSTYAYFDPVVQSLGFLLKKMVKEAEICDASKGALSSYAYLLLLIHFLQKVQIIPNLQEGSQKPENQANHMTAGWNTYFVNEDEYPEKLKVLKEIYAEKIPKQADRNNLTGMLFIFMLRYYAYEFDWGRSVVNLRLTQELEMTTAPHTGLTCSEKRWTAKTLCIEDPFDLNHNLGVGISNKMGVYIVKIFIQAYHLFFNSEPSKDQVSHQEYYLNRDNLQRDLIDKTISKPPLGFCQFCCQSGHFQRDCPFKKLEEIENEKLKIERKRCSLTDKIKFIDEKQIKLANRQKHYRNELEIIEAKSNLDSEKRAQNIKRLTKKINKIERERSKRASDQESFKIQLKNIEQQIAQEEN